MAISSGAGVLRSQGGRQASGDSFGYGGDVALKAHGFSAVLSYLEQRVDALTVPEVTPAARGDFARRFAFLQAGFMVLPETIEVAARVEYANDNEYLHDEGDGHDQRRDPPPRSGRATPAIHRCGCIAGRR